MKKHGASPRRDYAAALDEAAVLLSHAAIFSAKGRPGLASAPFSEASGLVLSGRPPSGQLSAVADVAAAQFARLEGEGVSGPGFAKAAADLAKFLMERSVRASARR